MRGLYAASDAFVLPSRGEGWGLPVMEAMAMAKPVLVTNYSGPTALMARSPLPAAHSTAKLPFHTSRVVHDTFSKLFTKTHRRTRTPTQSAGRKAMPRMVKCRHASPTCRRRCAGQQPHQPKPRPRGSRHVGTYWPSNICLPNSACMHSLLSNVRVTC